MALGTAAAITAGVGAATGGFQLFQGIKQTKEAKRAAANLVVPENENVYKDARISTVGADLMREESGRTTASLVDASRNAGLRGVLAGIPKIQSNSNYLNEKAQVELDSQFQNRERLIANDEVRVQGTNENRYNSEMAGIGQQLATGQQNTFSGIRGMANSGIYAAQNAEWEDGSGRDKTPYPSGTPYTMGTVGIPNYSIGTQNFGSSELEKYQKRKEEEALRNSVLSLNGLG